MNETKPKKAYKPKIKTADLMTKPGKYYIARKQGHTKKASALIAGYAPSTTSVQIEETKTYQALAVKDALLQEISLAEITKAHAENIRQTDDKGARNTAIKMAYERIEPEAAPKDEADKVLVILKQ